MYTINRQQYMKVLFGSLLAAWSGISLSALTIEVTGGMEGAIPIAIAPFGWSGNTPQAPEDIAAIVRSDLASTGKIKVLAANQLPAKPTEPNQVKFSQWQALAQEGLVFGQFDESFPNRFDTQFYLYDVFSKKRLIGYRLSANKKDLRRMAHQISNQVYQELTGEQGAFTTHIAYITVTQDSRQKPIYRLMVADADGYGARSILTSRQPIMSPAWAPDGKTIAYVSFEHRKAEIFVQNIWSGQRENIVAFPGINGAPAWSPDGQNIALTLSKDGNPDIYIYNVANKQLKRVVQHYAVDTEPSWSPDGSTLVFTSDRGGSPQIYTVSASGGRPKRITFEGSYNARATYSPNGKLLALVHRSNGQYRIAVQDLSNKTLQVISQGKQDESPSFAPNGSMILYATQAARRGQLAAVSINGRVHQRLSGTTGEVREPAWASN